MSQPPESVLPGLSPRLVALLSEAAAPDRLALVGGAVRDLLRHRLHNDPWTGLPDLDLVVEGGARPAAAEGLPAAHRLARRLRQRLGSDGVPFYQEHAAYGTVELEVVFPEGPLLLDVATARCETYPEPGRNPQVCFARLEDDLARRDFTINAMALVLAGSGAERREAGLPAGLLDPYGGRADLRDRQLRFLHPLSVRDDPTRVLRGARYAARMGFELASESQAQLTSTLNAWPWPWRPGDPPGSAPPALGTRLRMELELMLEREAWPRGLAALQRWGGLALLDPALQVDRHWPRRLRWASRAGLPLLPALLAVATDPVALAERLQLPHRQHRLLVGFLQLRRRLDTLVRQEHDWQDWGAERWSALLEESGHGPEAVALALAVGVGPRRPLLRWWLRWRHLQAPVTAAELLAAGLRPGPELGARLRLARQRRLAGERR